MSEDESDAGRIEVIRVAVSEVIRGLTHNKQRGGDPEAVFRLHPPFDPSIRAEFAVLGDAPEPRRRTIHVEPWRFVADSPDDVDAPPTKARNEQIARDLREGSEDVVSEDAIEAYSERAMEIWRDDLESRLRDEITFLDHDKRPHTATVGYQLAEF